jgi:pantoate--beta-alanine ligase
MPSQKEHASIIYKILLEAKIKFGTKTAKEVSDWVVKKFENNKEFELEYFQIADEERLLTCIKKSKKKKYRAFIAVFVNKIRLIDTISLN